MNDQPNVNALWGALLIEELTRQGVEHFVMAPGSRSTPLVVAVARHATARHHICIDERSAAYLALGIARGSGRPAAVITTSGTAVANLLPAVVEASTDRVPLLLLTADRPPELRDCGANQTIRQTSLFGEELRWRFELPPPDDRLPARMVLSTAAQAYARAVREAGPVHLNCMFREPLAPTSQPWDPSCLDGTADWQESNRPFTIYPAAPPRCEPAALDELARELAAVESGLVVVAGHACGSSEALKLAGVLGWPLWADVRSGLRLANTAAFHMPHVDALFAAGAYQPAAIVQLGGRPTSKQLQQALDRAELAAFIAVDSGPNRLDPGHRVRTRVTASPGDWCREIAARLPQATAPWAFTQLEIAHQRIEDAVRAAIDGDPELSEPFVARWLTQHVPDDGHRLFLSSSLPIRDVQRFGTRNGPQLRAAANRGASGIDGVLATAAGYAVGGGGPVTLLIGDLALLHDLGSLALLRALEQRVIVIVLNNGGGSIFTTLPIAEHSDVFTPYFDTPHNFGFEGVAGDFGIAYRAVENRAGFTEAYGEALAQEGPALIEVRSSLESNKRHHDQLQAIIRAACQG